METPQKNKWGKFPKRQWSRESKIPKELYSEGIYTLHWEGIDIDTGQILRGFKVVMNCNLYIETCNLEDDMRKEAIILTVIKIQKQ